MIPKVRSVGRIDKSELAIPQAARIRCEPHLRWIRSLPCSVPGCRNHANAHHLTIGPQGKGRGLRAGDDWAVPLCHPHHQGDTDSLHLGPGGEWGFWRRHGIDPIALAVSLWAQSRKDMP